MEVPSTTWFSEALCTSLYKDSGSSTSPNSSCMTGLDDDASSANYISNNYTDLSHSCRNQISHDDSKKFNNNSGESLSDTNRNSDSDNATAGDKITDNNENNNYLMLQAKHRLTNNHAQEEYIDLDKLYQTQRTLLNNATPSGSSLNYQNHHHHLQHSINNPHHQNILAQQLSCLPKGIPRHNSEPLMRGHGHLQGHTHPQGHGFPAQIRVYPPQGRRLPSQGQVVPTQGQAVPTQGHTMPTQGQPLPPQGHPHHLHPPTSVSSSTSPTPLSHPLPHLNSDHNHRRNHMLQQHHHHHHLPPQLPAHQPTPVSVNNSHHTYSNNYPSVFNGDATPAVGSQHGRDGFGHSSTPSEPNDYSSYAQQQYSNYNEDPDSDSESEHQRDSEVQPVKKRPGRPRGSRRKKPEKLGRLWEFIRDLLLNSETCPSLICWDNYEEGMFRFVHSDKVAKLWGAKRDNPDMNYEKLSRAMSDIE